MGLSGLQFLGIAGGRAADIVRADDIRRSKEYNTAFNKFIDNNVGALKTASSKQKLILNKAKKDISQIVSTYLGGREDLSDSVKYEIANTIYASHGYNMKDVKSDAANRLQQYVNSGNDATNFNYVNEYITNAKDLTSERTLDQIASKHAQEISPMPNLDLAAKAVGLGKYKETTFVSPDTDRIEKDLIAATGYKPDTTIPEGPTVGIAGPVVDVKSKLGVDKVRFSMENMKKTEVQNDLKFKAFKKGLSKGDFDTQDIRNLIKSSESQQYVKKGIASGVDAQGYFTPKQGAENLAGARMDGFKVAVQQIVNAKDPLVGGPYIKNSDIRNELAGYAKGLTPIATTRRKEIGGIYERKINIGTTQSGQTRLQVNRYKVERYIYLGEGVPEIKVLEYNQ